MTALAGRYITDTKDFLAVTSEKDLIAAADDPRDVEVGFESFEELDAAVGDEAEAAASILQVINEAVANAEPVIESFAGDRYVTPYNPVDPLVRTLAVEYAWIGLQLRNGTISREDANSSRAEIRSIGDRIADGRYTLVSTKKTDSPIDSEEVFAHGDAGREFSRARFNGESRPGDRRLTWTGR